MRSPALVAVVTVAVALLAACGGASSGSFFQSVSDAGGADSTSGAPRDATVGDTTPVTTFGDAGASDGQSGSCVPQDVQAARIQLRHQLRRLRARDQLRHVHRAAVVRRRRLQRLRADDVATPTAA